MASNSLKDLKRHILEIGSLSRSRKGARTGRPHDERTFGFQKKTNPYPKRFSYICRSQIDRKETLLDDVLNFVGFQKICRDLGVIGWQKNFRGKTLYVSPDWILTSAEEKERRPSLLHTLTIHLH